MDNVKDDSRVLELDLICLKDGEVLARSGCETVHAYERILVSFCSEFLVDFLEIRRR